MTRQPRRKPPPEFWDRKTRACIAGFVSRGERVRRGPPSDPSSRRHGAVRRQLPDLVWLPSCITDRSALPARRWTSSRPAEGPRSPRESASERARPPAWRSGWTRQTEIFFYFFLSVRDLLPAQVGARLRGRETAGSGASYPESLSCRPLPASAEAQETV